MTQVAEKATLYLVELKVDADSLRPHCYTLYVDDDQPITLNRDIVVFTKKSVAKSALKDSDWSHFSAVPSKVSCVFDFTDAREALERKSRVKSDNLLNCLNAILDFMKCIQVSIRPEHRRVLGSLADHLTFNMSFQKLLAQDPDFRVKVVKAFDWTMKQFLAHLHVFA